MDANDDIGKSVLYGILLFFLIYYLLLLNSCAPSMRPGGYAVPVDGEWIIVPVKRVDMRGYWSYDRLGYYIEYPNGSAGGGVYKWYDSGEVVWDYALPGYPIE